MVCILSIVLFSISCSSDKNNSNAGENINADIDPDSPAENLLGSWIDVTDKTRFVNIIATDDGGCIWEDNEGRYNAAFKEGILTITVSEGRTAIVYCNYESGNLISQYAGIMAIYKKK